jgi:hypothetical protein
LTRKKQRDQRHENARPDELHHCTSRFALGVDASYVGTPPTSTGEWTLKRRSDSPTPRYAIVIGGARQQTEDNGRIVTPVMGRMGSPHRGPLRSSRISSLRSIQPPSREINVLLASGGFAAM